MKCMKKPWDDEPVEDDGTAQRAVIPELGGGAVQFSWRRMEQSRGMGGVCGGGGGRGIC